MNKLLLKLCLLLFIFYSVNAQSTKTQLAQQLRHIQTCYTSGNLDSLQQHISAAEVEAIAQKDYRTQVELLRIKGAWQFLSGEHSQALQTLLKGIRIGEQNPPCHELVIIYYEAGTVHSKNKNLKEANDFMKKGLALAVKLKDTSAMADGNNRIGILFENQAQLDSALHFYQKSFDLNRLAKDSLGLSYSLENMATVLAQQKHYTQAIINLRQSLAIRKNKHDQYGIAIATINLSECYLSADQIDSAIFYALRAEEAGRSVGFLDLLKHTYKQLSQMYKKQKQFEQALIYHERFVALQDSIFNEGKSKQIAEMTVQFDTERKEQKIKDLNRQKTIQTLGLVAALLALLVMVIVAYTIFKNRKLKEEKLKAETALQLQLKEAEARNALQNERLRISRELHDNIGAHLTFINATVDSMDKANEQAQQVKELTTETIKELRKTVWLINKSSVPIEEFVLKLRDFLKIAPSIKVVSYVQDVTVSLTADRVTELFRATQESVNNALKYAQASEILVRISDAANSIKIEVNDNGRGFDVAAQRNKGFGLDNMQHRIEAIGGSYQIQSQMGLGTQVTFTVSLH